MILDQRATADAPAGTVRSRPRWVDLPIAAGLVVLTAGTFLPWLTSGSAQRNSYATDGVARRLLHLGSGAGAVLKAWPFLSLLCAVALALLLVGFPRSGRGLALLCALAAAAVCVPVLLTRSHGIIRAAMLGPGVTFTGCCVVVLAVLAATLVPIVRPPSSFPQPHPHRRPR